MFSRSSKKGAFESASSGAKPVGSGIPSILSEDLSIVGNLISSGDLQIDGTVEGDVTCHSLTVGEQAVINGSIKADEVRVCGTVTGHLMAQEVALASTAKVVGDIIHTSLAIEAGAHIEGQIRRLEDEESPLAGVFPEVEVEEPESTVALLQGQSEDTSGDAGSDVTSGEDDGEAVIAASWTGTK